MRLYHVISLGDHRERFESIGVVKYLAVAVGEDMQGIVGHVKHHVALFDGPFHSGSVKSDL